MMQSALLALVLLRAHAVAAETCPWLNPATAEGLLGVPVEVTVTHSADDTTCVFSGHGTSMKTSLRIEITSGLKLETAGCSSPPIALKAIGNEAQACTVKGEDNQMIEGVFGRVRDQLFQVEIVTDIHASRVKLRGAARAAAFHVAGSLF